MNQIGVAGVVAMLNAENAGIRAGDRITIVNRFGQQQTGRVVMPCRAGGWVLNMGGRHGTPGIANDDNIVKVAKARKRGPTI